MIKKWSKNILGLGIGLILAAIILEVFLRIFNPLQYNLEGDKIIIPKNKTYHYGTNGIKGVDSMVINKKNSLGFRGENPPKDFKEYTSLVFVGGSTTECVACGKDQDWSAVSKSVLQKEHSKIWVNNAGLDGHSTFGHTILVSDYLIKLKPKFIAFLIGANDIRREDLAKYEYYHLKKPTHSWKKKIVQNSKLITLYINLKRSKKAIDLKMGHKQVPFSNYENIICPDTILFDANDQRLIMDFKRRVEGIISLCKENDIKPIFITQPTVMGAGIIDKINYNTLNVRDFSGKQFDYILNRYNDITRNLCSKHQLKCIDLWSQLPKNPSYYYDEIHFTKAGCKKVGEIVGKELSLYLKEE